MPAKSHIVIIEDEPEISRFLEASLVKQGYGVKTAADGKTGLKISSAHPPDLIILDLGLPDMDGKDVIKALREWNNVPIIILSARDQEAEKVAALELGADDYLTKPFGTSELLARKSGQVVTQAELLRAVWGKHSEERDHYLRIYVQRLRQKIGDDPLHPQFIFTEPGVGYRLSESE